MKPAIKIKNVPLKPLFNNYARPRNIGDEYFEEAEEHSRYVPKTCGMTTTVFKAITFVNVILTISAWTAYLVAHTAKNDGL